MARLASVSVLGLLGVLATNGSAHAENVPGIAETSPGITPEGALAPISVVEGPGFKIGEGTVLHPILGLETGYVSNVFYEAESPRGAGILRLIAQLGTGSLSPQRLAAAGEGDAMPDGQANVGAFQYRADLRLTYDFHLSGADAVAAQNGLGVGFLFRGSVYPQQTWSFLYLENFNRLIRATNFESESQTNRDINRLQLGLQFAPGGRAITGLLHFENVIDIFEEEDQRFANRMQNSLGLTGTWRWLPMTQFFADLTIGAFGGLGAASEKVSSYPLSASAGVQTQLTVSTTLIARAGYQNGFYATGASYSAALAGLQLGWRYTPTGRVTAIYDYSHQDSINANYFRDHAFRLLFEQQFHPFVVHVQPELRLRHYAGIQSNMLVTGPDTRDDLIIQVAAGARYNFRDSLAGVLEYRLSIVETDYRYMISGATDDPSYMRHEIVAGIRAAL